MNRFKSNHLNTAHSGLAALLACAGFAISATAGPRPNDNAAPPRSIVQTAASNESFETLVAAIKAAGLVEALEGGEFTVFAPTDDAFAKLPAGALNDLLKPERKARLQEILKYHVVPGRLGGADVGQRVALSTLSGQRLDITAKAGGLKIDQSAVQVADIGCTNGVIHVVDTVLIPSKLDIVATADKAGGFETLLKAAKAAGLVEALQAPGPLTVLAPTDEAFAKLGKDTIRDLLKPENKQKLADILKLHVISGRVFSDEALRAANAKTLSGESVNFRLAGGVAMVDGATLIKTDIDATNGVIHVIDSVLLPKTSQTPTMPAASSAERVSPRTLISTAIERGVPEFNNGDFAACAAIYEVATLGLLALPNDAFRGNARADLVRGLDAARNEHNVQERAWILRRALDAAYESAADSSSMMRMTPSR